MSVFKCKMCGGALEIAASETVATCEYCGTQQTLPTCNDDILANLHNRANTLRLKCEFDKAEEIYNKILEKDNNDAEAHWGVILCKYGIEYVEDPKTLKRVPTCHRTSFDAVSADEDYKAALANADTLQREIYEAEAREIERIQKDILAIVNNEKPFDVFICYKETDENGKRTQDSVIANDIYHQLTTEGLKVFYAAITLEDKIGREYEPYIFAALNSARVMLVVGSRPEYFNAVWVKNEWSRFLKLIKTDRSKLLIPCYKNMDAYELPEEFAHLQAQDMGKIGFINDVVRGIRKVVTAASPTQSAVKEAVVVNNTAANSSTAPLLERAFMFLEDGKWQDANIYCEKTLDIDPKNAEAYLAKLMAELQVRTRKQLADCAVPFNINENYDKLMRFGDDALEKEIRGYIEHINDRNETARKEGIYQMALAEISKGNLGGYDEAIKLFLSINGYKDSAELLKEYSDKKNKIESDVVMAIKQAKFELLRTNAILNVEQNKNDLRNLIELKNSFHSILNDIAVLDKQEKELKKEIGQLEEIMPIGLFVGKQKKEIREKIGKLRPHYNEIKNKLNQQNMRLMGCKSLEDVNKAQARISQMIELAETSTNLHQIMSPITLSQAVDMIKSDSKLRQKVSKEYFCFEFLIAKIGDIVNYGHYNDHSIEWLVLAKEENRVLITSKYALDCKQYNMNFLSATWETCLLRKWLNNEFINTAFSAEEKAHISTVTVSADKNPEYSKNPGNKTQDKVFLLSIVEAEKYFTTDEARKCVPTAYAKAQGAYTSSRETSEGKGTCWWWLRSPGISQRRAAHVDCAGSIYYYGEYIDSNKIAVRPALWIELD